MNGTMSKKAKSELVRGVVRRNIKSINRWRKLGVKWKQIYHRLNIPEIENIETLANHYNHRGLI